MPGICKKAPLVYALEEFLTPYHCIFDRIRLPEKVHETKPQQLQKVIVQKEN